MISLDEWTRIKERKKTGQNHDYVRANLDLLDERGFFGWKNFNQLIDEASKTPYYMKKHPFLTPEWREEERNRLRIYDRDLMIAALLLGGRISEVLMSHADNFTKDGDYIRVSNIPLLKRVERETIQGHVIPFRQAIELDEIPPGYKFDSEKQAFIITETIVTSVRKERPVFPIPLWEPWVEILWNRIEAAEPGPGGYRWLFPTSATPKRKEDPGVQLWIEEKFNLDARAWISPERAWQKITSIGERLGVKIWGHWFRSQRATQLGEEYQFSNRQLNHWVGWEGGSWRSQEQADRYTKTDYRNLKQQMAYYRSYHENQTKELKQ